MYLLFHCDFFAFSNTPPLIFPRKSAIPAIPAIPAMVAMVSFLHWLHLIFRPISEISGFSADFLISKMAIGDVVNAAMIRLHPRTPWTPIGPGTLGPLSV